MKFVVLGQLLFLVAVAPSFGAPPVDYGREIQPILAEHCFQCHGQDEKTREGNLRLDLRDSALKGGDSGSAAIAPGKPDTSAILARITSRDADQVMPPPSV